MNSDEKQRALVIWRIWIIAGYIFIVVIALALWIYSLLTPNKSDNNLEVALLGVAAIVGLIIACVAFGRSIKPVVKLERVRSDFIANASHELKTPVAGIALLSENIEQAAKDGNTEAILLFSKRLRKESYRMQHIVTDMLDLSRLEDEQARGRTSETCDFASVVAVSYDAHLTKADNKGIDLTLHDELSTKKSCRIKSSGSDALLLVDNLLDNAINYTEEGSVDVSITVENNNAVLCIKDTGIGIPVSDQERIFERFYRVDTARSREMGGTGLGLSLVRHAVEEADGTIMLESMPGKGSTFKVLLPIAQSA